MRGLSLAENKTVSGMGATDIEIPNINPPPRMGVIVNPIDPHAPAPVDPPPHIGPVFPPPATA